MAEAAGKNWNVCPFCDAQLSNKMELKEHLNQVHEISVRFLTNGTEYSKDESLKGSAFRDTDLGNKLRDLKIVLKESFVLYLHNLKKWIQCDISRSEFDESVRPFFTPETIAAHNEFLISFIKEIRSISKSAAWKRQFKTSQNLDSTESANVQIKPTDVNPEEPILCNVSGDISDLKSVVPDTETLYGLSVITAIENGCEHVDKKVIPLINNAVEELMKNMHMAIMLRRQNFRMRADGFVYDVGKVDPNEINPDDQPLYTGNVTLTELLDVLEAHPHLIPIKSVYNHTFQSIINALKGVGDDQELKNKNT